MTRQRKLRYVCARFPIKLSDGWKLQAENSLEFNWSAAVTWTEEPKMDDNKTEGVLLFST